MHICLAACVVMYVIIIMNHLMRKSLKMQTSNETINGNEILIILCYFQQKQHKNTNENLHRMFHEN